MPIAFLIAASLLAEPHQPPAEAFQACVSKAKGAACSDSHVTGTCEPAGDDGLACRPEGHHHHGPPPEAFEACKSKSEDATCTVTLPDGLARSGTCKNGQEGLACAPAR
jgi:hypothetical protein